MDVIIEKIKEPEKFLIQQDLSKQFLEDAFGFVLSKIDKSLGVFIDKFPSATSEKNIYTATENTGWTEGFWSGMLWLAYEITNNDKYRYVAEIHLESFNNRIDNKIEINHHDMGFLYTLSCVSAYKLTGSKIAYKAAIKAANHLAERFSEKGGFIQAWGDLYAKDNYRLIIDCLMNLPLLFWAHNETGEKRYFDIANRHMETALSCLIRDDGSTHHTYYFDLETNKPIKGVTSQGYSDHSAWSRGQAWGIYGLPLSYGYTGFQPIIEKYKKITNFFLNRLPVDCIPCWDLVFTDDICQRDSSAASIAACGMLHMSSLSADGSQLYKGASSHIVKSLAENYTTKDIEYSNGILKHSVYSIPHKAGIDECTIWGDYYYMEALVRLMKKWTPYW